MSPLFSTVGKLAYGLRTNWHGLISQAALIFISAAAKYQQILHSYLLTLLPIEGDGIASSDYATGWIMGNGPILGRKRRKRPYRLWGHPASNSISARAIGRNMKLTTLHN